MPATAVPSWCRSCSDALIAALILLNSSISFCTAVWSAVTTLSWLEGILLIELADRFCACWVIELPSTGPVPPLSTGDWPLPNALDRLAFSSANLSVLSEEIAYSTMNSTSSRVSMSA